ncbi:MAG: protease modulator HflK N-terminal domain-containing protein, partial [Acidiferrobacterales bacterium]
MSWDPNDKNNPWKSGGDRGPADLDAIVKDLQRKLTNFLGGRGGGNGAAGGRSGSRRASRGLISGALMLLLAVWAFTGFY